MKHTFSIFLIFTLSNIIFSQDNRKILEEALSTMYGGTLSYLEHISNSGTDVYIEIQQQKLADGTSLRVEETLEKDIGKLNPMHLLTNQRIKRKYYNENGCTWVQFWGDKAKGVRTAEAIPLSAYSPTRELSGREIKYNEMPCWKFIQNDTNLAGEKVIYEWIVSLDNPVILSERLLDEKGKTVLFVKYSDFDFHPKFLDDTFRVPSNVDIFFAKDTEEELKIHEAINAEYRHDQKRKTMKKELIKSKIKRNSMKLFFFSGISVGIICLTTTAMLKWKRKRQ